MYCDGTDSLSTRIAALCSPQLQQYLTGCPVSLGTVQAGVTIPLFTPEKGQKLSEIFQQLALTCDFIWGVNPQLLQVYFCPPTATAGRFNLTSDFALWDSISQKIDGADSAIGGCQRIGPGFPAVGRMVCGERAAIDYSAASGQAGGSALHHAGASPRISRRARSAANLRRATQSLSGRRTSRGEPGIMQSVILLCRTALR